MPTKTTKERTQKITQAAIAAGTNPYVRRVIEDEELRSNMMNAFGAVRDAYGRVSTGRPPKALAQDKKLQKDMKIAARSLREAADQIRGGKPSHRGGFSFGKALVVAAVGAGLVLILSEDARKAVLDRLFGSEEEFEYNSTTSNGAS